MEVKKNQKIRFFLNNQLFRLQLRIRALSSDLNEIQFKDPVTLGYFYEQIKNDFNLHIAPNICETDLIPVLLDLGCLEMRFIFFFLFFLF